MSENMRKALSWIVLYVSLVVCAFILSTCEAGV